MECTPDDGRPISTSPGGDVGARQDLAALDGADRKSPRGRSLPGVHARHLGRLAADQRATGLPAAFGDALDDIRSGIDVEFSASEIIEEEQRLGALHHEVVDAHGDEIDADRAVLAGVDGDLELGADAVVGGDQNRVA